VAASRETPRKLPPYPPPRLCVSPCAARSAARGMTPLQLKGGGGGALMRKQDTDNPSNRRYARKQETASTFVHLMRKQSWKTRMLEGGPYF